MRLIYRLDMSVCVILSHLTAKPQSRVDMISSEKFARAIKK